MAKTSFGEQLQQMWQTRPVRLPRQGPVAGVAAGFGRRYHVDPVLVRVAFVVSTLFGGAGIVLYLAAWLLCNQDGDEYSAAESLLGKGGSSQSPTKTVVLIVALAIAVTTMGPVGMGLAGSGIISLALMLAGWWMLHMRTPQPPPGTSSLDDFPPEGLTATGYPGAVFPPGATGSFYAPEQPGSPVYTPYTKLPQQYAPDPYAPQAAAAEAWAAATADTRNAEVTEDRAATAAAASGSGSPSDDMAAADRFTTADSPAADPATATATATAADADADADDRTRTVAYDRTEAVADGRTADDRTAAGTETTAASYDATEKAHDTRTSAGAHSRAEADDRTATEETSTDQVDLRKEGNRAVRDPNTVEERPTVGLGKTTGPATAPRPHTVPGGPTPPSWDPLGVAPLAWDLPDPTPRPVAARPARRPRSRMTPVVLGLAILASAGAGALAASGVDWMTAPRIAAVGLAVVGLGLVAGAFLRRGHGLQVVTVPLMAFAIIATAVGPITFDETTMGDRTWAPTAVADLESEYHLSMGSATLDLRGLNLTENRTVDLSVRMGEAKVLVPEAMTVRTDCTVRMGDQSCPTGVSGPNTPGAPVLDLNIDVRMGNVVVERG